MNYSNVKNVFVGLFLLLCIASCKNEEDHSPCGRPDCFVVGTTYYKDGVVESSSTQTYVTVAGNKLIKELTWDIPYANTVIKGTNEYDSEGRLTVYYTTNIVNGNSSTSKVTFEYDASDRLSKNTFYNHLDEETGYSLNTYDDSNTEPSRRTFYNLQDEVTAYKEFSYDANGNLIEELDYQGTELGTRRTYSDYNSEGEWRTHFYEVFRDNPDVVIIENRKITRAFEGCHLKTHAVEEDGVFLYTDVYTIENDLVVSTERFDAAGNTTNSKTIYEYDCD